MEMWFAASPLLVVTLGALLLMLVDAFSRSPEKGELALGTAVALIGGGVLAISVWLVGPETLDGARPLAPYLVVDRFALFFDLLICFGGAASALFAGGYMAEHGLGRGEFYPLLLLSAVGAMVLVGAGDLLSLFLGLETMSLGVYAMTGFRRGSLRSTEAAMKYFLLGSFAAALLLYGGALLYGATGHTDLAGIGAGIVTISAGGPRAAVFATLAIIGLVLVLVGLAFKVSAVPFHMWTPDAYDGAPTPVTVFMAVSVKGAAFAVMLRVLWTVFGDPASTSGRTGWPPVLAVLAVLTMTVGNLVAGRQDSVKRMLAYSSVAHAGYVLVGVVATIRQNGHDAEASALFYLLAYAVSTAGAFGSLVLFGSKGAEATSYEDLAGVGRRHPLGALAFTLFLLSLAGIPPTVGFVAKFYVLRAAIFAGGTFYWLALATLLNAVIAAYYYLRVIVYMYMREPLAGAKTAVEMRSGYVVAALIVCAVLVVLLGILPGRPMDLVGQALVSG
jgi:NADH-quinone oxidoreductase subunit N